MTWVPDPLDLNVGDYVIYFGKAPMKDQPYSQQTIENEDLLTRRIIYQITDKAETGATSMSKWRFKLRVAFDPLDPGEHAKEVTYMGSRNLKKMSLLAFGMVRMQYDAFIRQVAQEMGQDA